MVMLVKRGWRLENQKEYSRMSAKPNIVILVEDWDECGMKQVIIPAKICNARIAGLR